METPRPSRTCSCPDDRRCARAAALLAPPSPGEPPRQTPEPDRRPEPARDLDWLDPLDESELDALRLSWAFMT